jgi:hypothetical protein
MYLSIYLCGVYLKDYGHNIVSDVAFPLQLLRIVFDERQQSGHVEDDLAASERLVQRVLARLAVLRVEAAAVALGPI